MQPYTNGGSPDAIAANAIVQEARSWIGTRFHHQGRIKATSQHRGGCDCIGLVIGVAEQLGVTFLQDGQRVNALAVDQTGYGKFPDGRRLQQQLGQYLQEIATTDIMPGDVLLFRFDANPQHVALVSDYGQNELGIIHCYAQVRKVVEHHLSSNWRSKMVAAYRFS
jgi:NlpC/P60 family putative phage cell wall peptidase